jgi:flagellar hook-associated protein 1 FlgK
MSTLGSLLSVARDAMGAQSAALDLVGKNVTNANTPGFVRRTALLENRALGEQLGGVVFQGPLRLVDRFAQARVLQESGLRGFADSEVKGLAGLEAYLAPAEGSVGERLDRFFAAANDIAISPNDPTARSAFLARAQELATAFNSAASGLSFRKTDLLGRAQDTAVEVNEKLTKIADLNRKITEAQALGDGAPDLRDQRDILVREVGERMGAQAVEEPNGSVTLLSSGTVLVQGTEASSIAVSLDGVGLLRIDLQKPGGAVSDITSKVTSGSLGGLRQARDVDIPSLETTLDTFAFDFAATVNAVHSAGFGLDGTSGRALFATTATAPGAAAALQVDPAVVGQPDFLAASSTAAGLPGANDSMLDLAALANQSIAGLGSPASRFGALAGSLGTLQVSADNALELRENTVAMAETLQQQASGVSLEEEMVDLSRYQRAFEAATRVLRVADELLANLIREV